MPPGARCIVWRSGAARGDRAGRRIACRAHRAKHDLEGRRLSCAGRSRAAVEPALSDRRAHRGANCPEAHCAAARPSPNGLWQAGARRSRLRTWSAFSTSAPERISPSALLRPVFQDLSALDFARSSAVRPRLRTSRNRACCMSAFSAADRHAAEPRLSATLIEPANRRSAAQARTGARARLRRNGRLARAASRRTRNAVEGKRKLSAAETRSTRMATLLEWTQGWMPAWAAPARDGRAARCATR